MPLRDLTYATALVLMTGWLIWVGKPLLMPIIAALIAVYVLAATAESMRGWPLLGRLPAVVRRGLVLATFAVAVALLFVMVISNLTQVVSALSRYETNLDMLITRAAGLLGIGDEPSWETVRRATFDRIDARGLIAPVLLSLQGIGTTLFLVVLYASFFMAERGMLTRKLVIAAGGEERGQRALTLIHRVNDRVGGYLFVKTFLNIVLAALSLMVMLVIGIEFAVFWAVLIGFLNYIPYIGSAVGVVFPVLLSLAQFGSFWVAGLAALALSAAQIVVGAWLEPRMMGRAFNLSPFVVVLALAFWSALWGLPGAILAVPMTASLVIVLAEFRSTRPVAVMLSASGKL